MHLRAAVIVSLRVGKCGAAKEVVVASQRLLTGYAAQEWKVLLKLSSHLRWAGVRVGWEEGVGA